MKPGGTATGHCLWGGEWAGSTSTSDRRITSSLPGKELRGCRGKLSEGGGSRSRDEPTAESAVKREEHGRGFSHRDGVEAIAVQVSRIEFVYPTPRRRPSLPSSGPGGAGRANSGWRRSGSRRRGGAGLPRQHPGPSQQVVENSPDFGGAVGSAQQR